MDKLRVPNKPRRKVATLTVVAVVVAVVIVAYSAGLLLTQQSYLGPVTIYPIKYASTCPDGVILGNARFNSTHIITSVSNDTLSNITEKNNTSLDEIYQQTVHSDQFLRLSFGRIWIPVEWTYYNLGTRPTVISHFILLNLDGSISGHLQSSYDLDSHYISTMQVSGAHSCPEIPSETKQS